MIEGVKRWTSGWETRAVAEEIPRRHGAIVETSTFLTARRITVAGLVARTTKAALDTYRDSVAQALANLGKNKLYWDDDADARYLNAIVKRYDTEEADTDRPTLTMRYVFEFLAYDPFWYAPFEDSLESSGAFGPSTSPASFTLTNSGGMEVPPRFEITNPNSTDVTGTFKIENLTLGLYVSWTGTIEPAETLVIDCGPRTIVNGGADALTGIVTTSNFFTLAIGSNLIEYTGDTTVEVDAFWRQRWAS